jgi:hypothetical protein
MILAARWGGIVDMSRWRHILLASLPRLSAFPKPRAENEHDPDPTDNEIRNGDTIPYAGLLSCALSHPSKAAALSKVDALSGTVASPSANVHSRECDTFLLSRALAHRKPEPAEPFLSRRAEILPPHR